MRVGELKDGEMAYVISALSATTCNENEEGWFPPSKENRTKYRFSETGKWLLKQKNIKKKAKPNPKQSKLNFNQCKNISLSF